MAQVQPQAQAARRFDLKFIAAFAAIYIIWGSTFLAIRYVVEDIPPLLSVGLRSVSAGALLFLWSKWKTNDRLTWREWRAAAVGGFCFFVLCHGTLAWAEQRVPSGIAAVVLALIPIWVVVLDWLRPGGVRPARAVLVGVAIGFAGLVLLVGPEVLAESGSLDVVATVILALSALAWAAGTVYNRYAAIKAAPVTISAMQLLTGGAMLMVAATLGGDWSTVLAHGVSLRAWLALSFLVIFGSVIAFSAFVWLLQITSPSRVATYAYVNPVVAVALGWAFAGEQLTTQTLLAAAVIVVGVAIIIKYQRR